MPREPKPYSPTSEAMRSKIRFARFCVRRGIEPMEVAELVHLANRAFHSCERNCNGRTDAHSKGELKACNAFEAKAEKLGFKVTWPGLWPRLTTKDGYEVELP